MKRRTLIASIGAVAGTTLGAAAYTSATIDRSATIDVVTDDDGLIGITDSGTSSLITQNGSGLATDMSTANASGVNVDSTLTFGDETSAGTVYAFSVANNYSTARAVTLAYTLDGADPSGDNVQFKVYNADGTALEADTTTTPETLLSVATETANYTISETAASPGTLFHVVLVIDTTGVDNTANLSGTLSITA